MAILAVDFDGVLHDHAHPKVGHTMGPPVEGAKGAINALLRAGHKIIIHTVWPPDRHHVILDWLEFYEFPPLPITNIKPVADAYIDDKAIRFDSWPEAMLDIEPL